MGARLLFAGAGLLLACLSVSGQEAAEPVMVPVLEPGDVQWVNVKDVEGLMRADASGPPGARFFLSFHKRNCPFSKQWMPVYKVIPQAFPTERFAYIDEYKGNFAAKLGVMGTPTVLYFRDGKVQTSRMPFVHQPGRLSGTGSIQELAMFVQSCTGEHPVGDTLPVPEPVPEPMIGPTTRLLVQIASVLVFFEVAQRALESYYLGRPWLRLPDAAAFLWGLARGRGGAGGDGGAVRGGAGRAGAGGQAGEHPKAD